MSRSEPAPIAARRLRSAIPAVVAVISAALIGVATGQTVGPSLPSGSPSAAPGNPPGGGRRPASGQRGQDPRRRTPTVTAWSRPTTRGEGAGAVPRGLTVYDEDSPAVTNLDPDLLRALRHAARDAAEDRVGIVVNSGWRSPEYQERLLRQAVSRYGSEAKAAQWVATAHTSSHVSGHAVDIGPSSATAWLSRHGAEYRLCQVYRNEPWHYELRPDASDDGCPFMYADPRQDPRMHQ